MLDSVSTENYPACKIAEGSSDKDTWSQEMHDKVWRFLNEHRDVSVVIDLVLSRLTALGERHAVFFIEF